MRKLKLVKGLTYSTAGMKFRAEKGKPFLVNDETANALMSTGRFENLGDVLDELTDLDEKQEDDVPVPASPEERNGSNTDDTSEQTGTITIEMLEGMKKKDYLALAESKGIDLTNCRNDDERKKLLIETLGLMDMFSES